MVQCNFISIIVVLQKSIFVVDRLLIPTYTGHLKTNLLVNEETILHFLPWDIWSVWNHQNDRLNLRNLNNYKTSITKCSTRPECPGRRREEKRIGWPIERDERDGLHLSIDGELEIIMNMAIGQFIVV